MHTVAVQLWRKLSLQCICINVSNHLRDFFFLFFFVFFAVRARQACLEKPSAPRPKKHKHAVKNDSKGLQYRSDKDGLSVFTYFWFHTEDSSGRGKPEGLPILGNSCFKATVFGGGGGVWCGRAVLNIWVTVHLQNTFCKDFHFAQVAFKTSGGGVTMRWT